MRITNNIMVARSVRDITNNLGRLDTTQRDISTGKRIHRSSDDPTSHARAMVLRNNMEQNTQYQKNIASASGFLKVTDTTLGSYGDALQRLRQLAVQGANGNLTPPDRAAVSAEALQIKEEIRSLANTQVNGRYIFGGIKTDTEPYPADVTFGPNNTATMAVEIAPGSTIDYNITGVRAFGRTAQEDAVTPIPPEEESIYAVIDEFVAFLAENTSTKDISEVSLEKLNTYVNQNSVLRTEVGGKVNRLQLADIRAEEINTNLEDLLRNAEDTDIATASLKLNQHQAAFQAALSVGARAIPLSLVDFLR